MEVGHYYTLKVSRMAAGVDDIRSDIFSKGVARDGWREYGENVSIEKVQSGGAINARQNGYNDVLITGFHRGMEI